jgi:hypothetical protein
MRQRKHYLKYPFTLWTFDELVDHWVSRISETKMPANQILPHFFCVYGIKDSPLFTAVVDTMLAKTGFKIGFSWMIK